MSQYSKGDDWDKHWASMHTVAGLNPAQDFRRRLLLAQLGQLCSAGHEPLRLLDMGCGTGDFALSFQKAFPGGQYLGIDVSQAGIEICRQKVPGARFQQRDLTHPSPVATVDRGWATVAICSEVLEHVDQPGLILTHIQPYLAPSAVLLITVPGGPMSDFDKHIGHRQHFSSTGLKSLLEASGYDRCRVWGSGFPFFNLYRLAVILRGQKLVDDASQTAGPMSLASRLAMSLFGILFRFNLNRSTLGWQRFAVAVYSPPSSAAALSEPTCTLTQPVAAP
jgi:SAM-dependent methyltransferase